MLSYPKSGVKRHPVCDRLSFRLIQIVGYHSFHKAAAQNIEQLIINII